MTPYLPALAFGVTLGLSAGLSPGPLLTLVIRQTLRHGAREGACVAIAPILTDVPIILLSLILLNALTNLEPLFGVIAVTGSGYVFYLAYETMTTGPITVRAATGRPRSFGKGALVNFLNPHPYLFWVTVGTPYILKNWQTAPGSAWAFLGAFFVVLVGSKMAIALLVGRFRTFLQGGLYLFIMRVLGLVLVIFAFILLRDALSYFGLI